MPTSYQLFETFTKSFCASKTPKEVSGEYYGLPGKTVYHTYSLPLPGKGRLEINRTTPSANGTFSWHTEITLNDKESGEFIHVILKNGNEIEETYGKTVLEVSDTRARNILNLLHKAEDS